MSSKQQAAYQVADVPEERLDRVFDQAMQPTRVSGAPRCTHGRVGAPVHRREDGEWVGTAAEEDQEDERDGEDEDLAGTRGRGGGRGGGTEERRRVI